MKYYLLRIVLLTIIISSATSKEILNFKLVEGKSISAMDFLIGVSNNIANCSEIIYYGVDRELTENELKYIGKADYISYEGSYFKVTSQSLLELLVELSDELSKEVLSEILTASGCSSKDEFLKAFQIHPPLLGFEELDELTAEETGGVYLTHPLLLNYDFIGNSLKTKVLTKNAMRGKTPLNEDFSIGYSNLNVQRIKRIKNVQIDFKITKAYHEFLVLCVALDKPQEGKAQTFYFFHAERDVYGKHSATYISLYYLSANTLGCGDNNYLWVEKEDQDNGAAYNTGKETYFENLKFSKLVQAFGKYSLQYNTYGYLKFNCQHFATGFFRTLTKIPLKTSNLNFRYSDQELDFSNYFSK